LHPPQDFLQKLAKGDSRGLAAAAAASAKAAAAGKAAKTAAAKRAAADKAAGGAAGVTSPHQASAFAQGDLGGGHRMWDTQT